MMKTRRLVLLVIGVAALSAASIGYSNAKYRNEIEAQNTARLAKWTINPNALSGNLDLFSGSYTIMGENDDFSGNDLGSLFTESATPIGFNTNNLIAPGAKGSTVIDFSNIELGATEVAYQIKFVNIIPDTDGISKYVTIGRYGAGTDGKGIFEDQDTTLMTALKSKIIYTATVQSGQTISGTLMSLETDLKTLNIPANETLTISWAWPYDTGNDAQDTAIADIADNGVDLRLVIRLAYQAVQVD